MTKAAQNTPNYAGAHVELLLRYHRVLQKNIIDATGCHSKLVNQILDPKRFHGVDYGKVLRVRAAVERLLTEAGWDGEPAELWHEFDELARSAA